MHNKLTGNGSQHIGLNPPPVPLRSTPPLQVQFGFIVGKYEPSGRGRTAVDAATTTDQAQPKHGEEKNLLTRLGGLRGRVHRKFLADCGFEPKLSSLDRRSSIDRQSSHSHMRVRMNVNMANTHPSEYV